ncbi:hypothetical protein [Micromonospora sp. NBC_01796]|uniref:hypothetical protein n=1 Tax=Micromonospora sp. NBC_01796 TaxID=2975987 RepID=UPI002DDAD102|nr:hypothetical protein [Micromonospora sp. NBC_01796]WSA86254.1 hypothetical protein OIE47_01140 [Micromonospora sp. NBC_01796]
MASLPSLDHRRPRTRLALVHSGPGGGVRRLAYRGVPDPVETPEPSRGPLIDGGFVPAG